MMLKFRCLGNERSEDLEHEYLQLVRSVDSRDIYSCDSVKENRGMPVNSPSLLPCWYCKRAVGAGSVDYTTSGRTSQTLGHRHTVLAGIRAQRRIACMVTKRD